MKPLASLLLWLGVILVVAALVAWAAKCEEPPLVIGGMAPVGIGPFPLDGAYFYNADPKCSHFGIAGYFPDMGKALCMRAKALEYVTEEASARRIMVGTKFKACDWAYSSLASWARCVCVELGAKTPEIRFGMSPFHLTGSIGGVPWTGCAAGVAYGTFIRVNLSQPERVNRLVAWETANTMLAYVLDAYDQADGPITAAATNYAAAACGVP